MNLENIKWNHESYQKFIDYLYSKQDLKYRDFHGKLILDNTKLIGIRTPILKDIAKSISKGNYKKFIELNTHKYYEETIIHGLILGYIKVPFNELLDEINHFISYVDNWAINDIVCANLKQFKKNKDIGYKFILELLKTKECFKIRFALVLLLDFYIDEDYIYDILDICNNIDSEEYYVRMANAWLISICYIKYKDITYNFLLNNKLDNFTISKAISKIIDSTRVSKEDKDILREFRKKI